MTNRSKGRMRVVRSGIALLAFLATAVLATAATSAAEIVGNDGAPLDLEVNKGQLIRLDGPADTVFVADPEIADVQVKSPRLVYIAAKKAGETTLFAVDENDGILLSRKITVSHNLSRLRAALRQLLPRAPIDVIAVDGALVLTGSVGSPVQADSVYRLAASFVQNDDELLNQLTVQGPTQVNLRVRIAEVSRQVIKQLGINWDAVTISGNFIFGLATGNPVAGLTPGSFLTRNNSTNSLFFNYNNNGAGTDINGLIDALDEDGLIKIMAEPNLTALSGETASFLAGGEFPILVPQTDNLVTVEFKQFGVSLAFTPVLLDNGRISLRVRPEVSQLSTNGSVTLDNFVIPALTTRRAETTVELASGQSFAIAGLLQNNITHDLDKLPGLADLPILGPLFQSDKFQRDESELVILVTPYLVRPVAEASMTAPTDGFAPPNDIDRIILGRNARPHPPEGRAVPLGPDGSRLRGPVGFELE